MRLYFPRGPSAHIITLHFVVGVLSTERECVNKGSVAYSDVKHYYCDCSTEGQPFPPSSVWTMLSKPFMLVRLFCFPETTSHSALSTNPHVLFGGGGFYLLCELHSIFQQEKVTTQTVVPLETVNSFKIKAFCSVSSFNLSYVSMEV